MTEVLDDTDKAQNQDALLLETYLKHGKKHVPKTQEPDGFCQHCYKELNQAAALFCKPPSSCSRDFKV